MNWEAVGAIGETIGALLIILTLLFLAKETRTNTKSVVASSTRTANWGFAELDERIATSPLLAALLQKSLEEELQEFEEIEWRQFYYFARSVVGRYQDAYLQHQMDFHNMELVDASLDFMRSLIEYPAWRLFWEDDKEVWIESFVADVESRSPKHIGMTRFATLKAQDDR